MKTIKILLAYSFMVIFLSACGGAAEEDLANALSDVNNQLSFNNGDNVAPVISGSPQTSVEVGSSYGFTPQSSDVNNDTLSFSIVNKPEWAVFNTQTGALTGTPTTAETINNIQIIVSDGEFIVSLTSFSITVIAADEATTDDILDGANTLDPTPVEPVVNLPPTIGGTPLSELEEGLDYSFTPISSDPENDTLLFSILKKPDWLSFNASTGSLSGQPASEDVGLFEDIQISVTDGNSISSLSAFSITVTQRANLAPEVAGTPEEVVREGENYVFQPTVTDPEDDLLSFSVVNLPAWMSFDANTGELSGAPGADDIGAYAGIQITVTDGTNEVDLTSFDITVESTSATLSWTAPSTRSDGSALPLSELSGFKIYTGTDPANLTLLVDLSDSSVTEYKVSDLPAATYYYAVTSYNVFGAESDFSEVVSKTIN